MIAVEDLNILNMIHSEDSNRGKRKSIQDVAWHKTITFMSYKAAEAGRQFVMVNPAYTSQKCSGCGYLVAKGLDERTHWCPQCDLQMDRDLNAAKNILGLGLQSLGLTLEATAFRRGE